MLVQVGFGQFRSVQNSLGQFSIQVSFGQFRSVQIRNFLDVLGSLDIFWNLCYFLDFLKTQQLFLLFWILSQYFALFGSFVICVTYGNLSHFWNNFDIQPVLEQKDVQVQGQRKGRLKSTVLLHNLKMHFRVCTGVHLGQKLRTFDYPHQGFHKLHFKNQSGTLFFISKYGKFRPCDTSVCKLVPKNAKYEPI